jgi:AcrR family transcriptional regulator
MSEGVVPASNPRVGRTPGGRRRLRADLAVVALDLFAEHGYDATTVDQIAETAGVGRRTFFRYFRSKEEVVFPDHEERLAEVVAVLDASTAEEDPLAVVSRAAERVLEMYLVEPEVSLKRFELTRRVSSLRDKEIASIDRYQRVFSRCLQRRFSGRPDGDLRAAVAASSVVAAHNHVLREWLKSGGEHDALERLRDALRLVRGALASSWGEDPNEVVVSVVRTAASADVVRGRIESALRDLPAE